jgi:hypothetical protein
MKMTKSFKLIQGNFKIADARSIIQNLYHEKILYHNRQLAHIRECNDGDAVEVEKKIEELVGTRSAIVEFFLEQDSNLMVHIDSNIQISFNSGPTVD